MLVMGVDGRQVRRWGSEADGEAVRDAVELRAAQLTALLSPAVGASERVHGLVRFAVTPTVASPGFMANVEADEIRIEAATPRDLMDGLAWLRDRMGVVTSGPGRVVASTRAGTLAFGRTVVRPAFPDRGLVLGCDGLHDAWRGWLPFAAANGLTTVFFHDTPPSVLNSAGDGAGSGGRMFVTWERDGKAIRERAGQLALGLEFGGHHLSSLVPRDAFAEHPEWFRLTGGQRSNDHNLCVSSAGALATLREGARRLFARFPGFAVYHLWADDLRGGGWCECDGCGALSPSDQALVATNAVAEVLGAVAPEARLAFLAYHDTLGAPSTVKPLDNVVALWAPRNRCYAHSIDDGACRRNADHLTALERLARWFGGPQRVRVFEYYSDSILFKWMTPPHLAVLPRDVAAYRRLGVEGVYDLAVSPRPWLGPTWHAWWFARCAWEGGGDAVEALRLFCEANFGMRAGEFSEMYWRLDEACRLLLDRGELELLATGDVLDYGDRPFEALREMADRSALALAAFATAVQSLPVAVDGAALEAVDELAPTVAGGMHLAERVLGWRAAREGRRVEAAAHLAMADVHLRALSDWYHAHAGPAWAVLGERMLRGARWHTERVRAMA